MNKLARDEKGYALILVLILLLLGSLLIPPLLGYMSTGLKTGLVYEKKTKELYAADAGIEEGVWRIKYDYWGGELQYRAYDKYDFSTSWSYQTEPVNGVVANLSIQNVWIPYHPERELTPPVDPADARTKIESNKLMVLGAAEADPGDNTFKLKIFFTPGAGEEDDLLVESLGVWLPQGFTYVGGSSNLEDLPASEPAYSEPAVAYHPGGQAVVWSFSSDNLTLFPQFYPGPPQSVVVSFEYSANVTGSKPTAISWIETTGAVSDILPVTWDIDTRIYKITSRAGNTEVEAYSAKSELRKMGSAIAGDYKAIGNSNLTGTTQRSTWVYEDGVKKSSTTLNDIPNGDPEDDIGDVFAAYLYWSGSFQSNFTTPIWGMDTSANFSNWNNTNPNTVWQVAPVSENNTFRGHFNSVTHVESARYLTMKNPVNLTGYTPGQVVVEWKQATGGALESNDGLTFQISSDNGTFWSQPIKAFYDDIYISGFEYPRAYFYYLLPEEYLTSLFKMRFHLESMTGTGGTEYVYLDDIAVARIIATADTTAKFWINDTQVYLDDGEPAEGTVDITATTSSVVAFEKPGEYAYASFRDVTKLVEEYAEVVENEYGLEYQTGNAKYSVGDVQADTGEYRSYAGWSLIIIYSSPATAGHYLYLYDTLALNSGYTDLDFDGDEEPGGDITGFVVPEFIEGEVNAATLTCFVGEGDNVYTGDFLAFNAPESYRTHPQDIPDTPYKLCDGTSPVDKDNVWNSKFVGMGSVPGVDIDTFYITWDSGLLEEGDITAHIDIYTEQDNWMLIYMILSVRSETITSGTTHYVIRGG